MATPNRFPNIKKGTTFNGRDIKFYNGTGESKTAMPLAGIQLTMDFRETENGNIIFSFKTSDNSITITGDNVARMMPKNMAFPAATYITTLLLTFPGGIVKPYGGKLIWKIE